MYKMYPLHLSVVAQSRERIDNSGIVPLSWCFVTLIPSSFIIFQHAIYLLCLGQLSLVRLVESETLAPVGHMVSDKYGFYRYTDVL